MILPMTRDTEDLTLTAAEPTAGDDTEHLSLRDELANALADAGEGAADAAVSPAAAAPTRDAQGRFSRLERAEAPAPPEPEAAGAAERPDAAAAAEVSAAPASWSAAAKADFQSLPDHIRKEVLKREADMERGRAQWQSGAERLNRLDAILGPRADLIRLRGLDEAGAIQALFAAQDLLDRNPVEGLLAVARQYGVDPRVLAQAGAQQQPGGAMPPQVQPPGPASGLAHDVAILKDALAQQQRHAQEVKSAGLDQQLQAFMTDPANTHFDTVRERMRALLEAGSAKDFAEAYQQATWTDPDVRQALLRQAEERGQARSLDAVRAKAAQARHASGSITGSPSPGSSPGRGGPAPTLRDELMSAWTQHAL